ncbi:hypothetical protein [Bradyrhizobium sp. USDA 3650]
MVRKILLTALVALALASTAVAQDWKEGQAVNLTEPRTVACTSAPYYREWHRIN